jgi:chromosome segregation ATPase
LISKGVLTVGGVSVDTSGPSQSQLDVQTAYDGGGDFMVRLSQLAQAKSQHDEALAELNLGKAAKAALADAQRQRDDAAGKLSEASATVAAAKQSAATTVASANKTATDSLAKAKADADAIVAEAQRIHSDAQQQKADAGTVAATAKAELAQLRVEREAASRLAEEAETTRATFQAKTDRLHAVLAEVGAAVPGVVSASLSS